MSVSFPCTGGSAATRCWLCGQNSAVSCLVGSLSLLICALKDECPKSKAGICGPGSYCRYDRIEGLISEPQFVLQFEYQSPEERKQEAQAAYDAVRSDRISPEAIVFNSCLVNQVDVNGILPCSSENLDLPQIESPTGIILSDVEQTALLM